MKIGISSSCFYPAETLASLRQVGEAGAKTAEVFFNANSELDAPYLRELCAVKAQYGMDVAAVHPFMSFAEGFFLFSEYERRFLDSLEYYRRFFDAGAALGARWFVLHGTKKMTIEPKAYAERYFRLQEVAKRSGMLVAHENVVRFAGQSPAFLCFLRDQLGDDFHMTLDVKQARRAGEDLYSFLDALGESVAHVHISDSTATQDCLPPGKGTFDFAALFHALHSHGFRGSCIIELYRRNFRQPQELTQAQAYLENLLQTMEAEQI